MSAPHLARAVLCCALLRPALQPSCPALWCCAVLFCAVNILLLCCAMLFCAVTMLCCIVLCTSNLSCVQVPAAMSLWLQLPKQLTQPLTASCDRFAPCQNPFMAQNSLVLVLVLLFLKDLSVHSACQKGILPQVPSLLLQRK